MLKVPANYTRMIGRNCYFYVLEVHSDFLQCYVFSTCCNSQYVTLLFVTARGLRYRIFRSSLLVLNTYCNRVIGYGLVKDKEGRQLL